MTQGRKAGSRSVGWLLAVGWLTAACEGADPIAPTGEELSICHGSGAGASLIQIRASELSEHRAHGDYVARLLVDRGSPAVGDSIHFTRIGDAIASARATRLARGETSTAACRIVIAVAPGVYQGSVRESPDPSLERFPLVIDVPDLTLLGSLVMPVDAGLRATGTASSAAGNSTSLPATTLVASPGLLSFGMGTPINKLAEALIVVNAHPDGPRGDGAVIEGFIFQSGNASAGATRGGEAIFGMRAQRLVIRGNQFEDNFTEAVELRAMTALLDRNYVWGRGGSCRFCLFGPGDYRVANNRDVGPGGVPSIHLMPVVSLPVPPMVEPYVLPASALVTAAVTNNEIRNHQATPVGVGLRVSAVGVGAPDVIGSVRLEARENNLVNNRFGLMLEGGFPIANTTPRGHIDAFLQANNLTGSCQNSMLVSFGRHTTGLGLDAGPILKDSRYTIVLDDELGFWNTVWYSHPAGHGNTLTVDGRFIDSGSRQSYDGARVCSTP